ncbi:hypothetical protein ALC57_03287 [Trachymyrmex cornetzi]|uniref:Uncharacterized protein n=1 Tax=Trachymyrmex cornetzi TaxID=471704 RepID=A0A195EFK5_9HYME|nr:hypothetical protein ALC57_03287 [Trachymyrmex cornetzi]
MRSRCTPPSPPSPPRKKKHFAYNNAGITGHYAPTDTLCDEDSRDWQSQKACSREKETRSKKKAREGPFYKRLLPKKLRSGKEREVARERNRLGERNIKEKEKEKERGDD